MNIVVLAGGISTEREVSIVTGTQVCEALRKKGHHAILLDVYFGQPMAESVEQVFEEEYSLDEVVKRIRSYNGEVSKTKESRREFFGENVLTICQMADVVFMALHGENGENGKVQAAFDLFGIPYTGTGYLGSAIAMNKNLTKDIFLQKGVPTPKSIELKKSEQTKVLEKMQKAGISFPCVVKPTCGGSSIGVFIVSADDELSKAVSEAFSYEDELTIETYIKGREFSIGVVEDEAYPIIEIVPKEGFYDYKNKYQPGCTLEYCPAPLSKELTEKMQNLAVLAAKSLLLDKYCRIDFLMDEEENMYCLEANTLPGMTGTSLLPQEAAALGMDYATLCEKLVQVSMKDGLSL